MTSTFTLVGISTDVVAALNPGFLSQLTGWDLSFAFGVLIGLVVIMGYKAGGMR